MYNIKILNEAVSAIIELADNVSNDRVERSMIYHLLKFIRAAARDFPDNPDKSMVDILGAHAEKIKRFTDGKIARYTVVELNIRDRISLPVTNAQSAVTYIIQKNLRDKNADNYSAVHKIADLYLHRLFEYSDRLDKHPEIEDYHLKQTMLTAFCAEMGLHIGWLETTMRQNYIEYDDIIV